MRAVATAAIRGVIARDYSEPAAEAGQLHVAPPAHGGVEQARPRNEAGHGHTHRQGTPAQPVDRPSHDPAQPREDRAGILAAVTPRGDQLKLAVDVARGEAPVGMAQVKSEHDRPLPMGVEACRRPSRTVRPRRTLRHQVGGAQPANQVGGRAAGQSKLRSQLASGELRAVAHELERHGGRAPVSGLGRSDPGHKLAKRDYSKRLLGA